MPKESWSTTDNDVEIARIGVMNQATLHGLDVDAPNVKAFLENSILVLAASNAESHWLRGIIDEMVQRNAKPAPES